MEMRLFKKPKVSKEDLDKIGETIKQNKDCPYCSDLIKQNKQCMEKHGVKNNLRSITMHQIKCKDCRNRIMLIVECKKKGHK
jgi:hypothetical protein